MTDFDRVVAAINGLKTDQDARHEENRNRAEETARAVAEALRGIDELRRAFPNGDPDGHRRFHEAIIQKEEDKAQFYRTLRDKLVERGLWALLALLGAAVWLYVKSKLAS